MPPQRMGGSQHSCWGAAQVTGGLLPGDVIFSGYDCDASRNWTLNGRPYARAGLGAARLRPTNVYPGYSGIGHSGVLTGGRG